MVFKLLRLCFSFMLMALLFIPFGVYHSRAEPYIIGSLWGYHLPIGYIGLLFGLFVLFYSRLTFASNRRFGLVLIVIGFVLMLSFLFSPKDYFINVLNGTSFQSFQIDIDYPLGNSIVLGLSLLSIATGFAFRIKN